MKLLKTWLFLAILLVVFVATSGSITNRKSQQQVVDNDSDDVPDFEAADEVVPKAEVPKIKSPIFENPKFLGSKFVKPKSRVPKPKNNDDDGDYGNPPLAVPYS